MADEWADFPDAPTAPSARQAPALRPADPWAGFTSQAPPASTEDRSRAIATDFFNLGPAAAQGTTPNIAAQMPQFISSDVHESDSGEILYRDPKTGRLIPTDTNKQVVLRDPSDNKLKLFARTQDTDEGRLSALGRILATGMASGSPGGMVTRPYVRTGPIPTTEQLVESYRGALAHPDVTAFSAKPEALATAAGDIKSNLFQQHGIADELAPTTFSILSRAERIPEGPSVVTTNNVDTLRRVLGKAAKSPVGEERTAATVAIHGLDDALAGKIPAGQVLSGNPSKVAAVMEPARENYAGAMRAQNFDRRVAAAELGAGVQNSGMNVANKIYQNAAWIIDPRFPERRRGYSPEALAEIERLAVGSVPRRFMRGVSNFLGGGGGLGAVASAAAGHAVGGTMGAILSPSTGFGLKLLENRLAMRHADRISNMIRAATPLGRQMATPMPASTQRFASPFAAFVLATQDTSGAVRDRLADAMARESE
jgi:hypothetical protein